MDDPLLRAVWHRILLAWGIAYLLFASGLRPPYPYADLFPHLPFTFEALALMAAGTCFAQVVLWRQIPPKWDARLVWVLVAVNLSWIISIVIFPPEGLHPNYTGSGIMIGWTSAQFGMYQLVSKYRRRDAHIP